MPVGGDDETQMGTTVVVAAATSIDGGELIAKRYKIVRWLGGGGMGRVYEVIDTELDERVALKVLKGGLSADALERFRREVKLTRRIVHRNVARMYDIGDHGAEKFLTMELVDGESLAGRCGAVMPWDKLEPLARQLCAGLAAAHATGVVHRDLKPDNVMIERGTDRAVIMDFGVARGGDDPSVTQLGAVVGTPRYMAPEQLAGRDIDARSDLFALGLMLYELASGHRPWTGDSAIAIAVAQQTTGPRPLSARVPPMFADLVMRCLALDPARRPASAAEILDALERNTELPTSIVAAGNATQNFRSPPRPTLVEAPTHTTTTSTVAVLPVACAPGDEYLADGMLDDLIDTLSSAQSLRVRPAGVVRSLTEPDPRIIGRQLAVDHVVVASIRRTPAGLRIAARLINIADGFQVWVHRTDCTEAEILTVSEDLGRGIAAALSSRATAATRPTDPRAVDLYLRARAELRRFWGSHIQAAYDLLDEAATIAPGSAPIFGARAYAAAQTWMMRGSPDLLPRARIAVEQGLATGAGEAYLAAAILKLNSGQLEEGARELGTALVRAPMSAQAHELAGRILIETEATEEARHHFAIAAGLDPGRALLIEPDIARLEALHGDWTSANARIDVLLHHEDQAIAQVGATFVARFAGWRGDRAAALAAAQKFAPRVGGDGPGRLLGYVRTAIESSSLDPAAMAQLAERFKGSEHPRRPLIFVFQLLSELAVGVGNLELALALLREADTAGLIDIAWLDHCPLFAPLAGAPELRAIRDSVAKRAAMVHGALRSVLT